MPGAPSAPAASHAKWSEHTSVVTTVTPVFARHSPRNGFNGFLRDLLGDRAFLPPSPAEVVSANLIPASGDQDHTTLPSAGCAFVAAPPRPPHPAPRFVTIASRPSCETRRRGLVEMICPTGKAKNFFDKDWTGQISLNCFNKSNFWRIPDGACPYRSARKLMPCHRRTGLMAQSVGIGSLLFRLF